MATPLKENGDPVTLKGVTVRTPGLNGQIEVREAVGTRSAKRGEGDIEPALIDALQNARTTEQFTIELFDTNVVPVPAVAARRGPKGEDAIEVTVPGPGKSYGQFILATDEAGVVSWHFARTAANKIDTTRGAQEQTFLIPRRSVKVLPAEAPKTRGLVGFVGKQLLKVLVFPLIDPLIGEIGSHFVSRWEERNRPYGFRTFTPGNYSRPAAEAIRGDALAAYSGKKSLLFVHGTFSRAASAFGDLDVATMETLYNRYQQRMFAFDHPTMSESPEKNINWFFRQLPNDANLNVDIVCHSRGGLVSRELARRTTTGRPSVSVDRIVFVAAPNAGTILTDGKHMNDFIDSYTNLLQLFPDNAVTDTLEAIIAVVKQLAVDILEGLEGLESMLPNGKVLQGLDAALPEKRRYFALASNFEPGSDANIAIRTADGIIDRIFEKKANDLVVPTDGVYQFGPAGGGFGPNPDERLQLFKGPKAPAHTRFFADPLTQQSILKWLA